MLYYYSSRCHDTFTENPFYTGSCSQLLRNSSNAGLVIVRRMGSCWCS